MLTVVLLVAAYLRLVSIESQGLWGDEALTLVLARWPVSEMLLFPTDPTPPLYYMLHKWFLSADVGAGMARSISVVSGLVSVLLMYPLGRLAYGAKAGLIAAALLAVWPQHVDFSQEARAYSLLFLLTVASATSLLWWWRLVQAGPGHDRSRIGALLLFALTTALTFYTHLVAVFWILLSTEIFRWVARSARPRRAGETAFTLALMVLIAIPGIIRLGRQFTSPHGFNWLPQASTEQFISTILQVFLPLRTPAGTIFTNGIILWTTAAVVLVALLWLARKLARSEGWAEAAKAPLLVMFAFLSLPLLVWLLGFLIQPLFMERTILYAIPGSILAVVTALQSLRSEIFRSVAGAAIIAALFASTIAHGTMRPKEDWRGAYSFLAQEVRSGDVILLCAWQYPSLRHAASRPLPAPLVHWVRGTPVLMEDQLGGRRDWDELFFRYNVEPISGSKSEPPFRLLHGQLRRGSQLWLVESDCPEGTRRLLERWMSASGSWRESWTSSPRPTSSISVSRSEIYRDIQVPIAAPRELRWPSL